MGKHGLFLLLFLVIFTVACAQQLDPIKNMCIRFDHQSVVKNNSLYIDGGRQMFVDVANFTGGKPKQIGDITEGYNDYLIQIDLAKSWNWKTNISETALIKKANPSTGTLPPVLSRGALFSGSDDDINIYLYGGAVSYVNSSFPGFQSPKPAQYTLWSYDTSKDQWGQYDTSLSVTNRPSSGSFAEARDQQLGFFFNGILEKGSEILTESFGYNDHVFLDGLVVVNTSDHTARNLSTTAVVGDRPRARGRMQYIDGIGGRGILVQIGGKQSPQGMQSDVDVGNLVPLDTVDVFDVSSLYNESTPNGTWYKQKTYGDIPPARIDFCLVLASPTDGSSRNIYMYGGRSSDGTEDLYLDDVWVLSIPSFTWTILYNGTAPRFGHTCHRVGERTMITVGGASNLKYTELPCDWEYKGVGVLDMSEVIWGSFFNASPSDYRVPALVSRTIGGDANGSASLREPQGGFDQEGLARMFSVPWIPKPSPGSPSNTSSATRPGGGANQAAAVPIIGGIIGGVTSLGLISSVMIFYRRRLKRLFIDGSWPFEELDGQMTAQAELETATKTPRCELPAYEPAELSGSARATMEPTPSRKPPRPWAPPVTDEGVLDPRRHSSLIKWDLKAYSAVGIIYGSVMTQYQTYHHWKRGRGYRISG